MIDVWATGDRIKTAIRMSGRTIKKAAEELDVDAHTLYHYGFGTSLPKLETLAALADLLGCTIDELVVRKK